MFLVGTSTAVPHIQSGALRGLAVTAGEARSTGCRTCRPSPKPDCRVYDVQPLVRCACPERHAGAHRQEAQCRHRPGRRRSGLQQDARRAAGSTRYRAVPRNWRSSWTRIMSSSGSDPEARPAGRIDARRLHLAVLTASSVTRQCWRHDDVPIPNFADVAFATRRVAPAGAAAPWLTPEGIAVKPVYGPDDVNGLDFLDTYPGIAPYLRGPYPTMYVTQPWTIRQYAGFSTAEDSNAFYRRNLAAGQKGLSVAFDLATHRGYDCDHPRVPATSAWPASRSTSIYDMRTLFAGIPLDQMTRVDDHERRGAAGARALHRRRRGAGRAAGEARRHDPERHPQRVHGAQHLHLSARTVDAHHLRHLRLHLGAHAEVQLDLDLRLSHAGGRRDAGPRARLHAGRRRRIRARRARRPGSTSTRSRRGCRSSGRSA